MADRNGRRLSVGGMVAGGFLLGAGAFGLFRVSVAQPLPDPALPSLPSAASALPAPSLPAPSMPTVEPASGTFPPISAPTLPALPALPKPDAAPLPKPALEPPPLPKPPVDAAPVPKPALEPPPLPKPAEVKPVEPAPLPKPTELAPLPLAKPDAVKPPEPPAASAPLPSPFDVKPVEPTPLPPTPVVKPAEPAPLPPASVVKPAEPAPPPLPPLPAKSDFNLRPEQSGLNVNVKDAAPTPAPALPQPRLAGNESLPTPRKVGDEIIPAPRPVIEQTTLPAPTSFAPGDAPMPIPTKQLALSAALGIALAASPVSLRAEDPKPGDKKPLTLDDLAKELEAVKADLKVVKAKKDELELTLNGRTDGKGTTPSEMGVLKRLEKAEADAKAMADRVKDLETKLATKTVAEKAPLPASLAGKGTVRLVNEFRTKLSIMVNGTSYVLDANEVKTVVVGQGEFKYELIEFPNASAVTSTIAEGETVTLRIK